MNSPFRALLSQRASAGFRFERITRMWQVLISAGLLSLSFSSTEAANEKVAQAKAVNRTVATGSKSASNNPGRVVETTIAATSNEKHQSKELRDLWKYSVPIKAMSPHQLPVGKLVAHLRKRRIEEIRNLLKETPVHPGDADERIMWEAACLASRNRPEQAVVLFDKVKSLDSAPVLIVARAAQAYANDTQYSKAIKLSNIVLAKYEMSEAYQVRAGCYSATNRLTEAAADFEKLATFGGSSPIRYYCQASSLLLKAGKVKEASTMVDRGIKAVPGDASAPLIMVKGDCYKAMGRWQDAINCVTEAIRITQSHAAKANGEDEMIVSTCYKERAMCYQKLGRMDLAKKDLKALEDSSRGIADEIIGDR